MENPFDILVYLDDTLVKNLASLVLTGYIETITLTKAVDRAIEAGMKEGDKIESTNQGSLTRIEREGFKDRNQFDSNNNLEHHHYDKNVGARRFVHEEQKIQTTFTTFVLNGNLMNYFNEHNELHRKEVDDIENDNVEVGDLIELEGTITSSGVLSFVETLMNLIEIFGCDYLNELTKDCNGKMKFEMIQKMLTYLKSVLNCNNTQDLIMKVGNGRAVLTINKNYFMNNTCNVFDKINCHCKVIGKVIKTCKEEEDDISLLRKTGQEKFYENCFEMCKPLLECLKKNGIMIPECPDLRINKSGIQIMPLNIYM
ncbi:hypothetical protein HF850_02220 [Clostridium sp. SM-530-WT-3G]|nr:hypothetical protein [Clostridium sp. SM-530-WT-3G]